jgi:hypothetical protein
MQPNPKGFGFGFYKTHTHGAKASLSIRIMVLLCRYRLTGWSGIRGHKTGKPKAAESLRMIL